MQSDATSSNHAAADVVQGSATVQDHDHAEPSTQDNPRVKIKQRRNKPTLSCLECVARKTRCDRAARCSACVKRQTDCEYTAVAKLITSSKKERSASKTKTTNKATQVVRSGNSISHHGPPSAIDEGWSSDKRSRLSHQSSYLQSSTPFSKITPSNVFGVGTKHAFSNYWTCGGGIQEVLSVLPPKDQTDVLVAKYFESVDPVYPHIHRRSFYASYERFWAASPEEQAQADPSLIALLFAMFSLGTQFQRYPPWDERSKTAEFYSSAAHQALRVYSYLNRTSMRAITAMLLIGYFLMNDNHVSDAFAWAGLYLRQAYAMRLHRDPAVVVAEASVMEKQQRRKLWQAVFLHDTFLTILLKLPPTATHSDVSVESLTEENELHTADKADCDQQHSRVENLMSIAVIAPQDDAPPPPLQPHHILDAESKKKDLAYIRSMWQFGILVQENLSSPNSLSLPLADDPKHKESLVASFWRLYRSFPPHLTELDYTILEHQAQMEPRAVRQNLFLNNYFFHCLMLLETCQNEATNVRCNTQGALQAAHEVLWSYFKLWQFFPCEAYVWWETSHRAFEASLVITRILSLPSIQPIAGDEIVTVAKTDILRMLETIDRCGEMHRTRWAVLQEHFEKIII